MNKTYFINLVVLFDKDSHINTSYITNSPIHDWRVLKLPLDFSATNHDKLIHKPLVYYQVTLHLEHLVMIVKH